MRTAFSPRYILLACLALFVCSTTSNASYQQLSVEDIVGRCDVIVLGSVTATDPEGTAIGPMKQLFTRHTFTVEMYYKGSGPAKIDLYTHGGFETDQDGRKTYTTVSNAPGVRVGEVLVLFLKAIPEGYWIAAADGAKYEVRTSPDNDDRTVNLRLRKKKYMKNEALEGFGRLEKMEGQAAETAGGELRFGTYQEDRVRVEDLQGRLQEIILGEGALVH